MAIEVPVEVVHPHLEWEDSEMQMDKALLRRKIGIGELREVGDSHRAHRRQRGDLPLRRDRLARVMEPETGELVLPLLHLVRSERDMSCYLMS